MFRHIGKVIWYQSREIKVYNHCEHLLFSIPVNGGTLSICQNKSTNLVEWVQTQDTVQVLPAVKPQDQAVNCDSKKSSSS